MRQIGQRATVSMKMILSADPRSIGPNDMAAGSRTTTITNLLVDKISLAPVMGDQVEGTIGLAALEVIEAAEEATSAEEISLVDKMLVRVDMGCGGRWGGEDVSLNRYLTIMHTSHLVAMKGRPCFGTAKKC